MAFNRVCEKKITKTQINKIHELFKRLNFGQKDYQAMFTRFKVTSVEDMTQDQARENIKAMSDFLDKLEKPNRLNLREIKGCCNQHQLDRISYLWGEIPLEKDYSGLRHMIKKITGEHYLKVESMSMEKARDIIIAFENYEEWREEKGLK